MVRLLLIGAGKGGAALLTTFGEYDDVQIIGVADRNENAEGLHLARKMDIPVTTNFEELLKPEYLEQVDLIVNVTGSHELHERLRELVGEEIEIMEGHGAKFLWHLVDEKRKKEQEARERLMEQQALYKIGLMLSSADKSDEVLSTIMENAIKFTKVAAGSIVLFEEESGEMVMAFSKGFSPAFSKITRWKLRPAGLTSRILDSKMPVIVPDLLKDKHQHNQTIVDEKVRALMAVPLRAEGKVIGIIYVNDFKPRHFTSGQISIMSLLATQASFAIENIMLLEKTEIMAITDELTKLFNHRFFVKTMNDEVKRAIRYKHHLSIIMIDVDHFKHYNDTHGHLMGNEILKDISAILKGNVRDIDFVARYGGEEFSIILPQTDAEKALLTAERIRTAVNDYAFKDASTQPSGRITVSLGVATFPEGGHTSMELVGRADEALYRSKRDGRNRVCCYKQPLH